MRKLSLIAASLVFVGMVAVAPSHAQMGPGGGSGGGPGWGSMMMGPGMMGGGRGGGAGRAWMCDPRAAGMAEWRMDRIERLIKPTDAQRTALEGLRTASAKAAETIAAACPKEFPAGASARMEAMEKRMETMLAAIKTVRPAFDAFYTTLTDEQKKQLDARGPRRWGWHGWR
ncbi:MAG: Spy/CpxP family protein refolding chaperone, partial [Pseudolabrys sp.]|nr:Spy/CpxP family protein refolding chaperone [Pseudolabrys sp.]